MVGGNIVKGIRLSCEKRAEAIRRSDGAFEMARPGSYVFALMDAPQPTALMDAPQPAATPSGIGGQVLAITGTPSSGEGEDLLPRLEQAEAEAQQQRPLRPAHSQLDTAQLPPVQECIQKIQRNQINNDDDRQKTIDDAETKRLDGLTARRVIGARSLGLPRESLATPGEL